MTLDSHSNEQTGQPFVSVVIPMYNGEEYLRECIESVLAQMYTNWELVILNNCSTDRSLEIAREYAANDKRIHVYSNEQFLPIIANHNAALNRMSPESKYCKTLMADDWLFPNCLEEMVRRAEMHPSIGLVTAYALYGKSVFVTGLPYPSMFVPGREICRSILLGGSYRFGSPTAVLIRADLIRKRQPFYNETNLHADYESCVDILQESDFGFVHQVLSYDRVHEKSVTTGAEIFETISLGDLAVAMKYGPVFLTKDEWAQRSKTELDKYYRVLARNVLRRRKPEFWDFQRRKLSEIGCALDKGRLARAVLREVLNDLLHPISTLSAIQNWWLKPGKRALHDEPGKSAAKKGSIVENGTVRGIHS